jgi:hypothetical protein
MPRSSFLLRLAVPAVLALVLPGCTDTGRDRDGDHSGDLGDILGGVLGSGAGGDVRGSGSGGDVLGGVLGGVLGRRTSYRCDDHRGFSAAFQPLGGGVSVEAEGRTYQLRPRDGGGYGGSREYESEDGDVRLAVEGDAAELSIGSENDLEFKDCRAEDAARPR